MSQCLLFSCSSQSSAPQHFSTCIPNSNPLLRSVLSWRRPVLPENRGRRCTGGVRCTQMDHGFYMRRCVELARRAVGCTSPNPMVGCVIVKDGEVVGEGFHPKAGQPHAEVFALRDAGALAENATAYVTLEPCNHYGRTPPCTEALISAKVKRVVVGMVDPNPIVASKGVERLRGSGIDVIVGVEEMLCRKLNEAYIHRMITGRPLVTLRYSLSFNGRVLSHLGEGADESGGYYSQLLQEYDGILISGSSLNQTSVLPTSSERGIHQPLYIIAAKSMSSLSLPSLVTEPPKQIIVLTEPAETLHPETVGVERVVLEKMNMSSILDYCGQRGLCSILVDIRGNNNDLIELLECSLDEHLLQKVVMELCPVWDLREENYLLKVGKRSLKLKDLESRISNGSVVVEGCIF